MALKVITDGKPVSVYRQDKVSSSGNAYTQYSIGVSSKNTEGNWVQGFIECAFRKGTDIPNKAKIEITNSFYTVNEYNGKKYLKLFVLDFNVVEGGEVAPAPNGDESWASIPDGIVDELPFN